ncbi:uncharacterized protein PV09_02865 [Verruconis gallopava]|uniref:NAD(P)-binding domain-containing protein n=1 Tax=Verruconis gallopava TaxID=253628 RepID=A0A0D2B5B2_9PEZI|nr:uncharacterized protein PV09_02865 [Verruconis gallopava]KIW06414.1 hypothetical protein PV09_02865 [Verruconis gallopava]
MAPIIWGLDLSEIQWSKFKNSYMWSNQYHLRRTKFVLYQAAMILCVVSESLGTDVLSDYVDEQKQVEHNQPERTIKNDNIVGSFSYNIFVGVYVATIFGSGFFFDLFWPERHESTSVKMAWRVCSVLACCFTLSSAILLTVILSTKHAILVGDTTGLELQLSPPLSYKHNGEAIASVVLLWCGWVATCASRVKSESNVLKMTTAVLAGSTGLVGSNILLTLLAHPAFTSVQPFTRRKLSVESPKLSLIESTESETWPTLFPSGASIFFAALGTTRAQAGGVENQRKIDLDLNLALAKAAKERGVQTYVLISSGGANASSRLAYPKMKGELEEAVKALGFKHTVILRPGLIVGDREDSRPTEFALRKVAGFMGHFLGNKAKDSWAQDADVIAKAAVNASLQCLENKREEGVWMLGQADIVKLGRTEWTEPNK